MPQEFTPNTRPNVTIVQASPNDPEPTGSVVSVREDGLEVAAGQKLPKALDALKENQHLNQALARLTYMGIVPAENINAAWEMKNGRVNLLIPLDKVAEATEQLQDLNVDING